VIFDVIISADVITSLKYLVLSFLKIYEKSSIALIMTSQLTTASVNKAELKNTCKENLYFIMTSHLWRHIY